MNPVEIGKKFEAECYEYLKKKYDKVEWLSKIKFHSTGDFICYKNNKSFLFDARKSKLHGVHYNVDKIITKKKGKFTIISTERYKREENHMKIQIEIPQDMNKELKILKIRKEHINLQETLIYIIKEYFKKNDAKN